MKPRVQLIALSMADGTLAIMSFVLQGDGVPLREATAAAVNAEIGRSKFLSPVLSWRLIARTDVPTSREFREAWVDSGGALTHDMDKVRAIHMQRLRDQRAARLAELDAEWMRAVGQGDAQGASVVEVQRQRLRDMPQLLSPALLSASTPEEVAAVGLNQL